MVNNNGVQTSTKKLILYKAPPLVRGIIDAKDSFLMTISLIWLLNNYLVSFICEWEYEIFAGIVPFLIVEYHYISSKVFIGFLSHIL